MDIISVPLNDNINCFLEEFFKETSMSKLVSENCWIAGGFARLIGLSNLGLLEYSIDEEVFNYFFNKNGDVDIFTTSNKEFQKYSIDLLANSNRSINRMPTFQDSFVNSFSESFLFHKENIVSQKNKIKNRIRYIQDHVGKVGIKIQLVNKFFYSSIRECFESFDFTNCKFALQYKDNRYVVYFDKDVVAFEKNKKLNLEHSRSPLLAKRIMKYIKKGLEIDRSENNISVLKDFYYKVVTNSWDNVYLDNMDSYNFNPEALGIVHLNNWIEMSKEDLLLFIGKISVPEFERSNFHGSYGHSYTLVGHKDWALDLINER